jgi:hypothetical protein
MGNLMSSSLVEETHFQAWGKAGGSGRVRQLAAALDVLDLPGELEQEMRAGLSPS